MKKVLLCILVFVLSLSLLIGCGNGEDGTKGDNANSNKRDKQGDKEITKIHISYKSGDATRKKVFAEIFNEFNEINQGKYEVISLEAGSQTHEELLKVKMATGDFPEIWEVVELNNYLKAGLAAELPNEIKDLMKYTPEINGKVYYAPIEIMAQGVFYNRGIFHDNGIEVPKTYGEFIAVSEKLKAVGITPLAFGGKDPWHTLFSMTTLLQTNIINKNPRFNEDLNNGNAKWTDEDVVQTLQKYQDLFNKGYIDKKGALSTPDAQIPTLIGMGKAAMVIEGPWMIKPIMEANKDMELGYFPLPAEKAEDTLIPVQGLGAGWGLSADAVKDPAKKEAAIEFLKFFFSKEIYMKNLREMGSFSTIKEELSVEREPAGTDMEKALNDGKSSVYYAEGVGEAELPAGWWEYSWKVNQDLAVGVLNAQEAGQKLQEYYEKMLSEKSN
jgi:raffinose/stachyose/melibiose transport system substrate-binding protein